MPKVTTTKQVLDKQRRDREAKRAQRWASPGDFLTAVFNAAEQHGGDGESDMEAGDLQDFARALWLAMTDAQREAFMRSEQWNSFVALWSTTSKGAPWEVTS